MRITFVGGTFGQHIGGGERVMLNQANFLARQGHSTFLVTPGVLKSFGSENVSARLTNPHFENTISRIAAMATAIRETRPDVVIAHLGVSDSTAAVAGRTAPRLVIYSHGGPFVSYASPETRPARITAPRLTLFVLLYRLANLVMTNSRWCAEAFARNHIDAKVVYPGVDVDFFSPSSQPSARKQLAAAGRSRGILDGECNLFLSVGWFRRNKRSELLIKALGEVATKHPKSKVVFIGKGRFQDIQELARQQGLLSNVEFLDDVDDNELRQWYCAASAYVHMNGSEHFGLPIAEAQSCGTPCIVPSTGGGAEIVEEGRTGFLYKPGDASSLSERMIQSIVCPNEMAEMRISARERIATQFNQEVVNSELERLLCMIK